MKTSWEDSYYYRQQWIFVSPENTLQKDIDEEGTPDYRSYGLSYSVIGEYLRKKHAFDNQWNIGKDGDIEGYMLKMCLYFGWIIIAICLAAVKGSWIGALVVAAIVIVGAYFLVCHFYNNAKDKARAAIRSEIIERYLSALEDWKKKNGKVGL